MDLLSRAHAFPAALFYRASMIFLATGLLLSYSGVDGQIVTIVTDPFGTPVDGQPGTFDYPILTSLTLTCLAIASDGSPATVTSYSWAATNCYTRNGGVQDPCFYSLPSATGQNITSNTGLLATGAGTVTCTATIDGIDYTSDLLTLRISGVALTGGTEGTIAGGMGDGSNFPRATNALHDYTYILLDGSEANNAILFRCATGLGPSGTDSNDVIGDMYHNNVLLTDQVCNGFVIAQGVGNTFRFPGIYQARVCGTLTTSTEGVYTCTLTNSSMMDQSVSIGAYLSTRTAPVITAAMSSSSLAAVDIVLGSNITLTCTSSGSPPDTFTWMKDGVPVTQSTDITTVTYTNTVAVFSSSCTISNVSVSDNGTYTCTVTNPIGSDNYNFTVYIPKPTATIPAMVSVSEGESVTITCIATGVPAPSVNWNRADGSSLIDSRYVISGTSSPMVVNDLYQVTRNLTIMNIVRADIGVEYSCTVTNVADTVQSNVSIIVLFTPTISLEVLDQIQDEGDTASFTCRATGGPVPTISWYFNGALLANGATHEISETSVNTTTIYSTLTIMSVQSSDVGTYTCNATNVVSSDTSSGVLTVNVAPNITIPMEGQQFNIIEGSNGSITCTATGYPVPTVVWQNSDGSSLSNNRLVSGSPVNIPTGVGNVTSVSVELMVIGAMRVDTGMYRCSANNSVNSTTRNTNLTVQLTATTSIVSTSDITTVAPTASIVSTSDTTVTTTTSIVSASDTTVAPTSSIVSTSTTVTPTTSTISTSDTTVTPTTSIVPISDTTVAPTSSIVSTSTSVVSTSDTTVTTTTTSIVSTSEITTVTTTTSIVSTSDTMISATPTSEAPIMCNGTGQFEIIGSGFFEILAFPEITCTGMGNSLTSGESNSGMGDSLTNQIFNSSGSFVCNGSVLFGLNGTGEIHSVTSRYGEHNCTDISTSGSGNGMVNVCFGMGNYVIVGNGNFYVNQINPGMIQCSGEVTTGVQTFLRAEYFTNGEFNCTVSGFVYLTGFGRTEIVSASTSYECNGVVFPGTTVESGFVGEEINCFACGEMNISGRGQIQIAVLSPTPLNCQGAISSDLDQNMAVATGDFLCTVNGFVQLAGMGEVIVNSTVFDNCTRRDSMINNSMINDDLMLCLNFVTPYGVMITADFDGDVAARPIIAEYGDVVTLNCTAFGGPNITFLWYKNDVLLEGSDENILNITAVSAADGGLYECVVNNTAGNSTANITIYVPPRFTDEPQSVEAFIGTAVNLSCSADGFPVPVITWTFQAMPFTNETVNSSNSTYTESTIVITNLLLSHGGNYSCQINSDAAVMSSSSSATVTVIGETVMGLVNTSAFPGQSASWNCQVRSTIPLQFMWYLNGQLALNTTGSHMDVTASSSYTLTNVSYSDNGSNVRCSAISNSLVLNSSDVFLTVLRPNITDITVTPSPSDNSLLHEFNDTVSLTCTAEGGPRIMTRWQFDNGSSVETVADDSNSVTYVVSSLSTDHTGVYYCEAIIDGMTDTSMNYTLFVAPYNVEITGTRRYLYGSDIELNCTSEGGHQLEYIWIFLDITIDNDAMLNISSATVSNGGNYICNVTNDAGSDINTTTVYIGPRFITDPVADLEVLIDGEFNLTCSAEGFPRPSIIWFMNHTVISNGVSDFNVSTNVINSTLTTSNAKLNDSGVYYCQAMSSEFTSLNVTSGVTIVTVVVPDSNITISPPGPIQGAMVGSPLVINCTVSTVSGVESSSVMISWTGPVRESIVNNSRLTISPTTSSGNNYTSSLQFTYLMEGDEGTYTCNVTVLDTIVSQSVELESLFVSTPTVSVTAPITQTVGQSLTLQCEVTTVRGITSRVDIVWSSGGTELQRMHNVSSTIMDDSLVYTDSYTISQLSTTDEGRVIQCEVVINASSPVMANNNITLDVTVPTPTVTISPPGPIQGAMVGSPLVINCTVSTVSGVESSSVMISWMAGGGSIMNDSRLTISPTTSSGNNYTSNLQFTYLMEGEEGTYTCNVTVLDTIVTQSIELESFLVPTPTVSVTAPITQTVGQSLTLQCEVTTVRGITSRVDIVWSSDGTELQRTNNVSSTTMNNSLVYTDSYTISQLNTTDEGRVIQCEVVINESFVGIENNITLDVNVSPRFITNPEASQEVVINGGFSLTCTAEGFPRPSIIWFMNDTMISNGVSDFNTSMTVLTSTLTISNANFNDSGMYYCQAVSSEFADLNVTSGVGIIAVVERPVVSPQVYNVTLGTNITFDCNEFGSPPFTYQWYMRDAVAGEDILLVNETGEFYTIESTMYNDTGGYFCEATNSIGILLNSTAAQLLVQPRIVENPVMQVAYPGVMVDFSCRAEGFSSLNYSWFIVAPGADTGMEIENETDATYIITDPMYDVNATGYYCIATNNEGIAISNTSMLTVLRPNITNISITPPSDNNLLLHEFNDTVSLTCAAEGGPRIMTRWQFNNGSSVETVTDGSNSVTYSVPSLSTDHTGVYYCEAIIDGMINTSMNYTLFVAPYDITIMGDNLYSRGEQLQLNCLSEGGPILEFTWLLSGDVIPNANTSTLTIDNVNTTHAGDYTCNVTNDAGTDVNIITVYIAPYNVTIMGETLHNQGERLQLSCLSKGGPVLEYSWIFSGDTIPFANTISLTIDNLNTTHAGDYTCNVTNIAGYQSNTTTVYIAPYNVVAMGDNLYSQGEQLQLNCSSEGGPLLEYTWLLSGDIIPNANTSTLTIDNVNTTHAGDYTCNVTNNAGTEDSNTITVYIAPYNVVVMGDNLYNQGEQLQLNCLSEGGPVLEYSWIFSGSIISKANTLTINNVNTTHAGDYICNVTNDAGTDSDTITVYIAPYNVIVMGDNLYNQGEQLKLNCSSEGGPVLEYAWLLSGNIIPNANTSTLTIDNVNTTHAGDYTCNVTNDAGIDSDTITVYAAPYNVTITETVDNNNVTYVCHADGGPGNTYEWLRLRDNEVISLTQELILDNRYPLDGGDYECTVTNTAGNTSANATLNVAAVIVTSPQTQNVTIGQSFMIICNATGYPVPSVEWTLNGTSYIIRDSSVTSITLTEGLRSNTSVITVTNATTDDAGIYECTATNVVNTDTQDANVTLQNCPDEPTNVQIFNVSSRSLTISWNKPYDNNDPITGYNISYQNPDCLVNVSNVTQNVTVFSVEEQVMITGLHPGEVYTFIIVAINNVCPSQASLPANVRTMEEVPGASPVVTTIPDHRSINVSWVMSECQDHHGNITLYEVRYSSSDFMDSVNQTFNTSSGDKISLEVAGLEEFANYTIEVRAYTAVGPGPYSNIIFVQTLPDIPSGSVTNLNARDVLPTSVELSWGPVNARDQNGIILSYNIYYRLHESNPYSSQLNVTERNYTIGGLMENEVYLFAITAVNQVGESIINSSIMIQTNESLPSSLVNVTIFNVTDGDDIAVFIKWDPPSDPNGVIHYYRIEFEQGLDPLDNDGRAKRNISLNDTVMNVLVNSTSGSSEAPTNVTVSGLVAYRVYNYSIFAATSVGEGPPVNGNFLTREDTPFAPENLIVSIPGVTRNLNTLLVNWERPLCDRGILSGYELCYVESSVGDCNSTGVKVNITGADQLSYTISDLYSSTNYTVEVRGRTGAGLGDPATATATTDIDRPVIIRSSGGDVENGSIINNFVINETDSKLSLTCTSIYQNEIVEWIRISGTVEQEQSNNLSTITFANPSDDFTSIFRCISRNTLLYKDVTVTKQNPFYELLTNRTIYAPLASSPMISIIVAIDSDGTTSQQDDVTESLILARTDDEEFVGEFEQDSTNFQLYHYMFPPLRRENMGQYIMYSEINDPQQIEIESFEVIITTEELILTRSFASVTLLEGSTVTLSCIPSVIETVLSWSHDGTNVNEDENTSFSPVNLNHNLILDNSDEEDSGQYTCRATLDDEVVEQSITVTVVPACVNDFSGALFWNNSRRNLLVTQPCSTLHPSFRSGVNIARRCNTDGTWSPVDMTACTMFINSNPVIVVHFTVTVSDSSTVDPTIIISNVLKQIELNVTISDSFSDTWSYRSDSTSLLSSFMLSFGLESNTISTNLVNDIKNNLLANASSIIPSGFVLINESFMISAFQPNSSCLCNDTSKNAVKTVCIGPSTAPCICSAESCTCNKPTYIGDDRVCGLDSDGDGFPDEALHCSEPFCSKDVCPDIYSVTEDNTQDVTFCNIETNFIGGCPFGPDEVWNITWPATDASTIARQKCPGSSEAQGIATRRCDQDGNWEAPNVTECRTVEQIRLETRAINLNTLVASTFVQDDRDITEDFMPEVVVDIADELNEITNTSTPLLPNDVTSTANTLNIIISVTNITINEVDQPLISDVIEDAVDILDTLLDPRNDMSFENILTQSLEEEASGASVSEQLLMNTEQVGILLVSTLNTTNNETVRTISNPNIVIEAQIPMQEDLRRKTSIQFPSVTNMSNDVTMVFGNMTPMIEIPSSIVLRQLEEGNEAPVIFIVVRNSRLPTNEGQRVESFILSSQISADPQRRVFLGGETVQLTFNIGMQGNATRFNPRCEFFKFSSNNNESGRFSTDGITQSSTTNSTFVQCTSTHLTSFAVLVDVSGESSDSKALSIVGYIGCGISIACLLFTIAALIALRKQAFDQPQHFLHLNLCIALLLGLTTFVSGIETATEYRESCLAVSILLHYFFMAAFCWMLSEGVLIFIMLYFVFYNGFFQQRKFFFAIGWGLPIPIVAVSAAVSHEHYGINDRCWISEENGSIWAFIGPMLLIILVNAIFLIFILYRVYKSKQQKMTAKEVSTLATVKALLKAAVIVMPILGCTWVFGLLAINDNTIAFAWIFTIFNSLQGVFIMIFYVLRNDKFLKIIKCQANNSRRSKTLSTSDKLATKKKSLVKCEDDDNSKMLAQYNRVVCNKYVTESSYYDEDYDIASPNIFNIHTGYEFDENDVIQSTIVEEQETTSLSDFTPSNYLRHQQSIGIINPNQATEATEEAKL